MVCYFYSDVKDTPDVAAELEGSIVCLGAVLNVKHTYRAAFILNFANNAVISQPIAPEAAFVVTQCLSETPRIFICSDPCIHVVKNFLLYSPVYDFESFSVRGS